MKDRPPHRPLRRRALPALVLVVLLASCVAAATPLTGASAATSSATLSATVLSATYLDPSSCATGTAGVTSFGTVTAGSSSVTTADCDITWGSSNDTASLYLHRADSTSTSMRAYDIDELDQGFGTGGQATQDAGADDDEGRAVAIQPDGGIVVAGFTYDTNDWTTDIELSRFDASGAADVTFGTGGTTITAIPGTDEQLTSVVVQGDGKIVVGGWQDTGTFIQFLVARYTTAGVLDPSYGTGGIVTTSISSNEDEVLAMALQGDGKLVVAGYSANEAKFALARYDTSGVLDPSFGTGGTVQTSVGTWGDAFAMAIQPDGRILAAGGAGGADDDFAVVRYAADGTLDPTFGTGGIVKTALIPGNHEQAHQLALLPSGKIVVGGFTYYPTEAALVRYNADGSIDTTFGTAGKAYGPDCLAFEPRMLLVEPGSGNLLLQCSQTGVERFDANGALDTSFGTGGQLSPPAGINWYGMALDSEGSIILVGPDTTNQQLDVTRYGGGPVPDFVSGTDDWSAGAGGMFGACLRGVAGTGVTPTWTINATCPATNGTYWHGIPASSADPGSKVASSTTAATTNAVTHLRFGFRASPSQRAGNYTAHLQFDVLAPGT